MLNKDMMELGKKPSAIRELFEYGKRRAAVIGKDNVFDFSIGNPSVPAPQCVNDELIDLLKTEIRLSCTDTQVLREILM